MKTSTPTARCTAALLGSLFAAAGACAADGAVEKVTVRAVANFGFDQTTIAPADQARMLADVGKMQGVTWQTVTTTGHTDSVGPQTYNRKLSARRAQSVKAYLVGKGLDPAMIRTGAKAAAAPVADNGSAAGRAKNRRAEIEFEGVRATAR